LSELINKTAANRIHQWSVYSACARNTWTNEATFAPSAKESRPFSSSE